ncbi:UDP-GlcNAc:betaGal beta-1,3-N-acetylglucosaminyltransferase-like protein 1 [Culicoides brevitarsis]|uniref:UDP-GlcNAc:betaGal beta-1,3-N-acetylglucosaminyltransferase-like protein 1 n=1 Tax=Culicoides brevitarsis TaxID=469753 RepID=UPI00307CC0E3
MTKVSVIITVLNGTKWIESCFSSILKQNVTPDFDIEIVVFDDASKDDTARQISEWKEKFQAKNMELTLVKSDFSSPKGVGYGRNVAVERCKGDWLCFQDIDDVMMPDRIRKQLEAGLQLGNNYIIGSKFTRVPQDSTFRFTKWANNLPHDKLSVQIYTSNGPTLIMPTWFMHKDVFHRVGGFCEDGKGTPEDLIFFFKHLNVGGKLHRVDEPLLEYTYHSEATSFSVKSETIDKIRLQQLIETEFNDKEKPQWKEGFMIWNAGRQGRKFYRSLPKEWQNRVTSFCDVDPKLIGTTFNHYEPELRKTLRNVPIVSYKEVTSPVIICMKLDLTDGAFEENLASLNMEEGRDFILFS